MFPGFNPFVFYTPPGMNPNQALEYFTMMSHIAPFMQFSPSMLPKLPVNSPDSGIGSSNSSPITSGISPQSLSSTPSTSTSRQMPKNRKVEYCNVCDKNITEKNIRSQGPRRHILQHHLNYPLFKCPHCDYTSNYDKAHVRNHMTRRHKGMPGEVICADEAEYAAKEQKWYERCFSPAPRCVSSAPFSVDSLLSTSTPVSRPKSNSRFAPY